MILEPAFDALSDSSTRTGVTGYIGGDFLYLLARAHLNWVITCMVRDKEKGASVTAQYPQVRVVQGSNQDYDLIRSESKEADIVFGK